jgi:hypothetical protein
MPIRTPRVITCSSRQCMHAPHPADRPPLYPRLTSPHLHRITLQRVLLLHMATATVASLAMGTENPLKQHRLPRKREATTDTAMEASPAMGTATAKKWYRMMGAWSFCIPFVVLATCIVQACSRLCFRCWCVGWHAGMCPHVRIGVSFGAFAVTPTCFLFLNPAATPLSSSLMSQSNAEQRRIPCHHEEIHRSGRNPAR